MNPSRIGCSTITYRKLTLEQALEQIASHGFQRVDLGMIDKFCPHINPLEVDEAGLSQIAEKLKQLNLQVSSCNTWSLAHLNDPNGLQVEFPYLLASFKVAQQLGTKVVTVQPGRKVEASQWQLQAQQVVSLLEQLGQVADSMGLRLAIEAPHKGTLAEEFENAARLVRMLNSDLVGVVIDSSHIQSAGVHVQEVLSAYGDRVHHVHLRDYGSHGFATPGDGDFEFAALFNGLDALGYNGDFNLELEFPEPTLEEINREVGRALAFLHKEASWPIK